MFALIISSLFIAFTTRVKEPDPKSFSYVFASAVLSLKIGGGSFKLTSAYGQLFSIIVFKEFIHHGRIVLGIIDHKYLPPYTS